MPDNGGGSNILGKTTTDAAGEFQLAVLIQTQLRLEFVYPHLTTADDVYEVLVYDQLTVGKTANTTTAL
jgi:hypothetical protein